MKRCSFKIGFGLFGGVISMSVAGTPSLSADKPITIGLIMEARPEVEPWSLAWHDAAEAMKKKNPSIKVIESYEAYNSARAEPVARQMLDAEANVFCSPPSCSATSPRRWRRNTSKCRWE